MSRWAALERFPRTDPADVGCEQAMEMLHVYVDLIAVDPGAARRDHAPGRVRPALRGLPRPARRGRRRPLRLGRGQVRTAAVATHT